MAGMKMIISCRRRPDLSRQAFFDHLRHAHWPLVQRHPAVLDCIDGYVQNHALGDDSPPSPPAPFRVARDRDSVIELYFEEGALARLMAAPGYLEQVRPDEARFNDLASNVMVRTRPEVLFDQPTVGRCKRFDFIAREPDRAAGPFLETLAAEARRLALDPLYSGLVDRHVHNLTIAEEGAGQGFGEGEFDVVREVWAGSFEALTASGSVSEVAGADLDRSFSVFATEFVMKPPSGLA